MIYRYCHAWTHEIFDCMPFKFGTYTGSYIIVAGFVILSEDTRGLKGTLH